MTTSVRSSLLPSALCPLPLQMTLKPTDRVLPDEPVHRPLERFWPYANLPEQPTDEELAALHPELRHAIFGAPALPFSISVVFPKFEGERYPRALEMARASDEYVETT